MPAAGDKRYLVLAEEHSADPHYGKTAHGIIRYGLTPVVAILDSTRAGEVQDGLPVLGSVNEALCFNPTTAVVGVATAGGRFPPRWRELPLATPSPIWAPSVASSATLAASTVAGRSPATPPQAAVALTPSSTAAGI